MDNNDIYSELLNVSDKQNYTIDVVKRNADALETIKDMVSVQPEPPVVVVPDTVVIQNLPEVQKVEVLNPTEQVDLTSVEELLAQLVELVPDIKDERNAEAVDRLTKLLAEDQSRDKVVELLRAILDKEDKSFEIPAELLSKEGRIKVEVDRVGSFTNMGALTSTEFVTKQDELITAVENITIPPPVGGATEVKQDSIIIKQDVLISLTETLQELSARLAVIAGMANSGAPALRVIPIASVSTAVTGAVTVASTSITNFGTGIPAKEMADDINNYTAIVANINNVTA